jgi:hypothetical protein
VIRQSWARCAATLSWTASLLVQMASLGVAPIDGEVLQMPAVLRRQIGTTPATMWRGICSRRSRDGRRVRWCEEWRSGGALFIAAEGCCGCPWRSIMAQPFWCAKGQGEDGTVQLASWRVSRASWRGESRMGWRRRGRRLLRVRRHFYLRAAATGLAQTLEHVYGVAVGGKMPCTETEGQGRTDAAARAAALARPVRGERAGWHVLDALGTYGAGQCRPLPFQGLAWAGAGWSRDAL